MEVVPAETELLCRHRAGGGWGSPRHVGPPWVQVQKYCKVRVAFSVCREHLWWRNFASNFYVLTSLCLIKSFNKQLFFVCFQFKILVKSSNVKIIRPGISWSTCQEILIYKTMCSYRHCPILILYGRQLFIKISLYEN